MIARINAFIGLWLFITVALLVLYYLLHLAISSVRYLIPDPWAAPATIGAWAAVIALIVSFFRYSRN